MEIQNGWLGTLRRAGDWARRMLFGERVGDGLVVLEESTEEAKHCGLVVAVVFDQYPDELSADALLEGPIPPDRIPEIVRRVRGVGGPAPDWWLHGLQEMPWGADRTGRWVVELAGEVGEGRIIADLRELPSDRRRRLASQIDRWSRLRGGGAAGARAAADG